VRGGGEGGRESEVETFGDDVHRDKHRSERDRHKF